MSKADREGRIEELSKLEHRRWNACQRAAGWQSATHQQAEKWLQFSARNQNRAARLHTCLVEWDELPKVSEWLRDECGLVDDFQETDRCLVRELSGVLRRAAEEQSWEG